VQHSAAEDEPVQEAVIRYIICGPDGMPPEGNPVFFLCRRHSGKVVGQSASLIARSAGPGFHLRPISERRGPEIARLRPPKPGESGPIVDAGDVEWMDETHAKVEGGFYVAPLHAAGSLYLLENVDGRWRVVDVEVHWMS
jgi:hypothetical protein